MTKIFDDFEKKRSLVIVPHPDDDIIGAGGLLIKYGKNIDTICVSSSGIPSPDGKYTAAERNQMRLNEWYQVMERLQVNRTYINSTYGADFPFIKQLENTIEEMVRQVDVSQYDFIFVPGFWEQNMEHRWVTYRFLPRLLKGKRKNNLKIVLYEVWGLLPKVTDYLNISDVMPQKLDIFQIYESQLLYTDYDKRVEGLDRYRGLMAQRVDYAEAYFTMSVSSYHLLRRAFNSAFNISAFVRKHRRA